jgi:GH24 family phage-related lysozyme (muramidase)
MRFLLIFALVSPVVADEILIRASTHVIKRNEGMRLKPYKDVNGHWTVGIGHKIVAGEKFGVITEKEALGLFRKDIKHHIKRARRLLPDFDKYPVCVRVAILDGVFRGCLGGSPRSLALIRKGEWKQAGEEYLDHAGYRKSKRLGTGVWRRMDRNALVFSRYAEYLAGKR